MGLFSDIKDAVFGGDSSSGTSAATSSKTKTTSNLDTKGSTTYNAYNPSAASDLSNIAKQQSGLAGSYTDILSPYLTNLFGTLNSQLGNAGQSSDAFYATALKGVDPTAKANAAEEDVVSAFQRAKEARARDLGRYGIDPNKLGDTSRQDSIEEAKTIAGARTAATDQADEDSFNRLLAAMNVSGNTSLNTSNATGLGSLINSLMGGATQATAYGLTPQSITTLGNTSGTTTSKTKGTSSGSGSSTSTPSLWDIVSSL